MPFSLTISIDDTSLIAGETSRVSFSFTEEPVDFTLGSITAAGGTLSGFSKIDGLNYEATFTPSAEVNSSSNVVSVDMTLLESLGGASGSGMAISNPYAVDTERPTATIVVADPALNIGAASHVTITFSEKITGFVNADLTIANGALTGITSGDGGVTWTAIFTPTSNVTNLTNAIALDMSKVTDLAGNTGSGTVESNTYAIDTQRPTASIVVADTALGIGQFSTVTITFSEAVAGFTLADMTTDNGTLSSITTSDNITWTTTLTPAMNISATGNVIALNLGGVSDAAGNAGSGTLNSNVYAIDHTRPTATIGLDKADLRAGETAVVTITFSEAVVGFDNADLSIANGTLSDVASTDGGITWMATYTPNSGVPDDTNLIVLNNTGLTDLAGNAGTGTTSSANFTINTVVPTATISLADSALKVGETTGVTITFSEAVTGFDNSDLIFTNGSMSNVGSTDGGITWTATFTPTANVQEAVNQIGVNMAGVTNAFGNAGVGQANSTNYVIDTKRPTATITVANNQLQAHETTTVTIAFSEKISGFDLSDLSVANGTLSNLLSGDGGATWTATFTPTAAVSDQTNLIILDTAGVLDAAGNLGASISISNNYAVGYVPPLPEPVVPTLGDDMLVLGLGGGTVLAAAGQDTVIGGSGADFIHGNQGDDVLNAGAGADTVHGGQGDDFVQGATGDDTLFGDLDRDTMHGGQGDDFVHGNAGDDILFGDLGNDIVHGGQGHDTLQGGAGDDYLSGDLGDDVLTGGAGADVFSFVGGAGRDVVTDFSKAEGDHIRISSTDAADFAALSAKFSMVGADTVITLGAQVVVLVGVASSSLSASDFLFG